MGSELAIIDISVPEQPTRIGFVVLPGLIKDIVISGDYVYVLDGDLHIVDVSDPAAPILVGFLDTSNQSQSIAARVVSSESGQVLVFIVDSRCDRGTQVHCTYYGRLRVVDVTDPANPFEAAYRDVATEFLDAAVSDSIAYVTSAEGLRMFDVSDPANPTEMGIYETLDRAVGVEIEDSLVYLVVERQGLQVLDVSNASHPTEVGFYAFDDWCSPFSFSNNYRITIARDHIYLSGCSDGIRLLDISDPGNVSESSFYRQGHNCYSLATNGGVAVVDPDSLGGTQHSERVYAYISNGGCFDSRAVDYDDGLSVLDVSDPVHPVLVGSYRTPRSVFAVIHYPRSGGEQVYAFAPVTDGLLVMDLADPEMPTVVGSTSAVTLQQVQVADTYVYGTDGYCAYTCAPDPFQCFNWVCKGSVQAIDFADPNAPVVVGVYDPPGGIWDMTLVENHLYVLNADVPLDLRDADKGRWTMRVIDISEPAVLTEVGAYDLADFGGASIVSVRDGYMYLKAGNQLLVLDVTNPASPAQAGLYDICSIVSETDRTSHTHAGDSISDPPYFHVPGSKGAIGVVDVSTPTAPIVVGFHNASALVQNAVVKGRYAYAVTGANGLQVVDISDPVTRLLQ